MTKIGQYVSLSTLPFCLRLVSFDTTAPIVLELLLVFEPPVSGIGSCFNVGAQKVHINDGGGPEYEWGEQSPVPGSFR